MGTTTDFQNSDLEAQKAGGVSHRYYIIVPTTGRSTGSRLRRLGTGRPKYGSRRSIGTRDELIVYVLTQSCGLQVPSGQTCHNCSPSVLHTPPAWLALEALFTIVSLAF